MAEPVDETRKERREILVRMEVLLILGTCRYERALTRNLINRFPPIGRGMRVESPVVSDGDAVRAMLRSSNSPSLASSQGTGVRQLPVFFHAKCGYRIEGGLRN